MARIVVNSGLHDFVLLDMITAVDDETIRAYKTFADAPLYLGIESLAQLGAFHLRFLTKFEKHAFLLAVKHFALSVGDLLNGRCELAGKLLSHSSSAFSYRLCATREDQSSIEGEVLFGVVEYDDTSFRRDILKDYYQRVFSCLKSSSRANC